MCQAHTVPRKIASATAGCVIPATTRDRTSGTSHARRTRGDADRSASVTGAPSSSNGATANIITMCCPMCTVNRSSPYVSIGEIRASSSSSTPSPHATGDHAEKRKRGAVRRSRTRPHP